MAWWTLYKREMAAYFQSMIAYMLLCGGAFANGINFLLYLQELVQSPGGVQDILQVSVFNIFFFILTMVQVPLITMRTFSEEFKMGTIEMLLTAPVNEWSIVMAKFLGAFTFFLIFWSPLALDIVALQVFAPDAPPLNPYEVMTILLTLSLIGLFYCSLGLFSSVLTKNQIVSAIICFSLIFGYLGYAILSSGLGTGYSTTTQEWLNYFSLFNHMNLANRSILDTRTIVFYLSSTAFMLICTQRILLSHRLQG